MSSEQFYETDPSKPYRRGWSIQTVSPLPITWSEHITGQGHWGEVLREYMRDYVHWASLGALCEFLPQARNRVTLADETDRHGLPVAHFSYSECDNDKQLMKAAQASMETILRAAGADEVMTINRYAHLVGGARMATRQEAPARTAASSTPTSGSGDCRTSSSPTGRSAPPRDRRTPR